MRNILVIGAGRSTSSLIKYLLDNAKEQDWFVKLVDIDMGMAKDKVGDHPNAEAAELNIENDIQRVSMISEADIVVSMLPAFMHTKVAKDCVALKKNMVTASYISDEMRELNDEAEKAGVLIMNEIGVDPGIDHMSAMKVIDEIREDGGEMVQFESFTGGLVAPESDNNPWNYKFTWNPRNVVLAGAGGAVKFIQEGKYKYIPYHQLFRRTEIIEVPNYGNFEGYANRDSLKYREIYGLDDIPTLFRGTFRRPGFCRAWDVFVKLGATDDGYQIEDSEDMTYREFINLFLAYNPHDSVELKLMHYLRIDHDDDIMHKLEWLGIFENEKIGIKNATPAQVLQKLLSSKWQLESDDKDMIAMHHIFGYLKDGERKQMESSMVKIGADQTYTAMAQTVGYPVGIAVKLILNKEIDLKGVHLPIDKKVYTPVLKELEQYDITFLEREVPYKEG
jgi:saccharopine dehydrogenase-like NADP-dependent oxidoreductase